VNVPAWLLLLLVAVHWAPEHVAQILGHSQAAWEGVAYGAEAAALWGTFLLVGMRCRPGTFLLCAVAAYGTVESLMRPVCRLAFPMTGPPPPLAPGQTLCELAYGPGVAWLSVGAVALVAAIISRPGRQQGRG
jgi:hypothetical protein